VGKDSECITFEVPEGDPIMHVVDREGSGDESASKVEVEMNDEGEDMQERVLGEVAEGEGDVGRVEVGTQVESGPQ
jgi:hypothetical protein